MKTLIEVKTGTVLKIDETTKEGMKEYMEKSQSEEYMEWFCFGGNLDE